MTLWSPQKTRCTGGPELWETELSAFSWRTVRQGVQDLTRSPSGSDSQSAPSIGGPWRSHLKQLQELLLSILRQIAPDDGVTFV